MNNINNKKRIIILSSSILAILVIVVGTTFAFYNYTKTGDSNTLTSSKIDFDTTDDTLIDVSNEFPIDSDLSLEDFASMKNAHKGTLNITGHTTLTNGVQYRIYVIRGNDIEGKVRLNDGDIKFQLTPNFTSGANGFTVNSNTYSNPKNLEFDNEGKALISTGLMKDTTASTTVSYDYYFWVDGDSVNISSTTKREILSEGNPSLADATNGNETAIRYMRNNSNDPTTVTLFPARQEQVGKTIYTTYEFSKGYYNIKILVEAEDAVQ